MAALKWSLTALTVLLSFTICSSNKLTMPGVAVPPKPIITASAGPYPPGSPVPAGPTSSEPVTPTPSGPVPSGPVPSGPVPSGPVPSGPVPSGPVPSGPVPSGPVTPTSSEPVTPTPSGPVTPTPSGPVTPTPSGPVPSGDVRVWPVSYKPSPRPPMEASSPGHVVSPPKMTSSIDDNELGAGCGGGGIPGFGGGYGCQPAAPKNPYYCQPASCSGTPGYGGSGNGFTIYLGDNFPSSGSDDEHKS